MNLTWKIVAKDLQRHRWVVAFLATVFLAKIGLGVWELNSSTNGPDLAALWGGRGMATGFFLIAIESLLTFALVPAFIHEDPLVGSTAEWQTRPISGARLLGAKLLGLGLVLGVMPVLIGLPWWLSCGYGLGEVAEAAWETGWVQGAIALVALPIAALTKGYGRFIFASFLTWVSAVLFGAFVLVKTGVDENWTRRLIVLGLAAGTAAVVTVHQFLTRKQERSVGLAVAGGLAMGAVAWFWPAVKEESESTREESATVRGVTLEVGKVQVKAPAGDAVGVGIELHARGIPPGYHFIAWRMREVWTWADGTKLELPAMVLATRNDATERRLLGLDGGVKAAAEVSVALTTQAQMPVVAAERMRAEAPAFRGEVSMVLRKAAMEPEQALRAGERTTVGARISRIVAVKREQNALWVTVVESAPALASFASGRAFGMLILADPARAYWVLDRARGRAVRGNEASSNAVRAGTVEIRRTVLKFATEWDASAWLADAKEEEGAKLATVSYREVERFTRVAAVERLEVGR